MRVRLLIAVLVTAAGIGQAATIDSNTVHFSISTGTVSGNFNQFNPALGTLTGVAITLANFSSSQTMTASNIGGGATSIVGIFDYHGNLTLPSYTEASYLNPAGLFGVGCSGTGEIATCTQTDVYPPTPQTYSPWSDAITPSSLAGYIGNGTLPVSILVSASASVQSQTGNSPQAYFEAESMTGDLTLTYTYDPASTPGNPVPEPASMGLLGSALAGTVWLVRRQRR